MDKPFLIGITGGTASGKTFVIEALRDYFDGNILIMSQDQYYRKMPPESLDRWERVNLDEPSDFKNKELVADLEKLVDGKQVETPIYDFKTHRPKSEKLLCEPKPVIVLEGIAIFNVPEIRQKLDYKVFLESSPDIRLARRLLRDIDERGRTASKLHQDIERYINTVKPMYDKYVEPMKKFADKVYNTDSGSLKAAEEIIDKLKKVYLQKGLSIQGKKLNLQDYDFSATASN